MSCNLSFIFDNPIIKRQLNMCTNWTTALNLCSVLIPYDFGRLIAHWSIEISIRLEWIVTILRYKNCELPLASQVLSLQYLFF